MREDDVRQDLGGPRGCRGADLRGPSPRPRGDVATGVRRAPPRGPQGSQAGQDGGHRRPQRADGRHPGRAPDRRRAVAGAGRNAGAKLRRVRNPDLLARVGPAGHRARDRSGARALPAGPGDRLRGQPHVHSRRVRRGGDGDRDIGGGARARHSVPGSETTEDDADQLRRGSGPRGHREGPDPRDDRPSRRRRNGRPRRGVRRGDHPRALDGEQDDDLQHDDRGWGPRGHGVAGRDDLRVGPRSPCGAEGSRTQPWPSGARFPPTTAPGSIPRSRSTRLRSPRWSPGAPTPGWSSR